MCIPFLPNHPNNGKIRLKVFVNRVFQNTVSNPLNLIEKVKLNSFLWLRSKLVDFVFSYHDWWKHPIPCMGVLL